MSRARSCAYRGHTCLLPVLSGRQHCARHILHEPGAPYKQCLHTYSGGQRCNKPAPVTTASQSRDAGWAYNWIVLFYCLLEQQKLIVQKLLCKFFVNLWNKMVLNMMVSETIYKRIMSFTHPKSWDRHFLQVLLLCFCTWKWTYWRKLNTYN